MKEAIRVFTSRMFNLNDSRWGRGDEEKKPVDGENPPPSSSPSP
ncbi:MAG: hypothetical protein RIR79_2137, partial [Pseudomonadota bacterium]